MPVSIRSTKRQKQGTQTVSGLLGGLNTYQDENLIKDSELTTAKNIILEVDGISPRPGTKNYKNSDQDTILGSFAAYKSDGTRELLRISTDGVLKKYAGDTPTSISGATYDTSAPMNMLQVRDRVYLFNGLDNLSYYDFTSITAFTALTTPTNVSVSPQGTTGSETYSYRISAFNTTGETLASTAVITSTGNATLDATNHNQITWDAVTNATGYNIYGRKATGLGETYLDTVYTNSYDDKGERDPSTTILPPEGNNTAGVIGTMGIFAISRMFVAGDPDNPSRLYYGGVADHIDDFSGSTEGGGYVDVFRNDGSIIESIIPFQGGVIVLKTNAIYKFSFTQVTINNQVVSVPQLDEITRSFGGISFRGTKHVENDIIFPAQKDGRLAFFSLGNQENYAGSVLRTNELSIKVSPDLADVEVSELGNAAGFYFNNLYGCAIARDGSTSNNRIWLLDTRFGAWVHWDDLPTNHFTVWGENKGEDKLYYGHETNGYMVEMFRNERSDNGLSFDTEFATKSMNQKNFKHEKTYYDPTFQFKDVNRSGELLGEIYTDGAILSGNFLVQQQTSGGAGVGFMLPGGFLVGEASGASNTDSIASSDTITEIFAKFNSRSIKYRFTSSGVNVRYKFLSFTHNYIIRENKRVSSTKRTYLN